MRASIANWFYIFVVLLFGAMLFLSAKFFKGSTAASIGIASSREYRIASEKAAIVKSVVVVPGQQVKAGDLLIELTSAELEMDIDRLTNRIIVMKEDQRAKNKLLESRIAYIRASEGVVSEELAADLEQARSEVTMNKNLTKTFAKDTTSSSNSPLQVKINSLKVQQMKHQQAIDIRIREIEKENEFEQTELKNEIMLTERELELYIQQRTKLAKHAITDGVVGSVLRKAGEEVDAFVPLLTVTPVHPTTVIAYLVGTKTYPLNIGDKVTVKAYGQLSMVVDGKVVGYGSVVALPEILQRSTAVKAFGREVFIEISDNNDFANGQKVLIR